MLHADPYWLVIRAGREPVLASPAHHTTPGAARTEAERLAKAYQGVQFVVLETVSAHRAVDMEVVDLRPDRGVPF
jgi:hypothetical protein